jgi:beta-lactamase superfamily II metal-dependent hydrolase
MSDEQTIERSIHDMARAFVEEMLEKNGVKIDSIVFNWTEAEEFGGSEFVLRSVKMQTTTI